MTKAINIPEGYSSITPYLICRDAAESIAFYKKALGAKEIMRLPKPDGGVAHAEIQIGNARMMLGESCEGWEGKTPKQLGGTPVSFYIYVEDIEEAFNRARKSGCSEFKPIENMFWGDRMGVVVDPFGYQWTLAEHVRDVSPDEMAAAMKQCAA